MSKTLYLCKVYHIHIYFNIFTVKKRIFFKISNLRYKMKYRYIMISKYFLCSYTSFLHIRSMHKVIIFLIEYCNSIFAFKLKLGLLRYLGSMIGFVWIWWCVFCRNIQTIMLSKIDTIGVQQIFWTPCYESRNKMVR